MHDIYNVVIVGSGPAAVSCARILKDIQPSERVLIDFEWEEKG